MSRLRKFSSLGGKTLSTFRECTLEALPQLSKTGLISSIATVPSQTLQKAAFSGLRTALLGDCLRVGKKSLLEASQAPWALHRGQTWAPKAPLQNPIWKRNYSSPPSQHRSLPSLRDVWSGISNTAKAPLRAASALRKGAGEASSAVFNAMPKQVQGLVSKVKVPGSLQKALSLQLEAFWQNHSRALIAAFGVFAAYLLWKTLFNVTSIFVNLSETMAEFGFLALAAAVVAFGYLYLRHRFTINPDSVYRLAMLRLNTSPGVLEVMGAPLAGTDVRAYVTTGGGLRLKGLTPRLRYRRLHMIFPLKGAERRGLVSVEAKKVSGKYLFKLLALDVPSAAGPEQRLYLEGTPKIYLRGGVIGELRDPFLRALSMDRAYEEEDEADEEAVEAAEAAEKAQRSWQRASEGPKALDEGGGMYFYERAYYGVLGVARTIGGAAVSGAATARKLLQQAEAAAEPPPRVKAEATELEGDAHRPAGAGKVVPTVVPGSAQKLGATQEVPPSMPGQFRQIRR